MGAMPKRRMWSAASRVVSAISSGGRVLVDVRVGQEHGAAAGDQQAQRRELAHPVGLADDLADVAQVPVEAAFRAAEQRVGLAAAHRERADHGGVGAHGGARRLRRDAAAADEGEIVVDIVAVARVVLRVDELEVPPRPDPQAETLGAARHDLRAADQDRRRQPFLQDDLRGAQHALVLALGVDDALAVRLCRGDDRPHDQAGAQHETVEPVEIGVEIGDGPRRHARFHGGAGDRRARCAAPAAGRRAWGSGSSGPKIAVSPP